LEYANFIKIGQPNLSERVGGGLFITPKNHVLKATSGITDNRLKYKSLMED
jgi:hypothetical protein